MIDLTWKISYRALLRNRRRSLATGIAITAGFIGLTLLAAYVYRVEKILTGITVYINHSGHLSIYKKDSLDNFYVKPARYILTPEDQTHIDEILLPWRQDIDLTAGSLSGMGLISAGDHSAPFIATGIDPKADAYVNQHPFVKTWAPEYLPKSNQENFAAAVAIEPTVISITQALGEVIGQTPPFSGDVQLAARDYFGDLNAMNAVLKLRHTTGMAFMEATSARVPIQLLQGLYATEGLSKVGIFLKDSSKRHEILNHVQAEISKRDFPLEIYTFDNEKTGAFYVGTMNFLYTMAGFFIFLIVGAVALSIINSMTMGILERSKEIGTLRAIGFAPGEVTGLFVKEAFLLTAFSTSIGIVLALVVAAIVNSLGIRFNPPGSSGSVQFLLAPNFWICMALILLFLLISCLTSYLVVHQKTKVKIVELLTDSGA